MKWHQVSQTTHNFLETGRRTVTSQKRKNNMCTMGIKKIWYCDRLSMYDAPIHKTVKTNDLPSRVKGTPRASFLLLSKRTLSMPNDDTSIGSDPDAATAAAIAAALNSTTRSTRSSKRPAITQPEQHESKRSKSSNSIDDQMEELKRPKGKPL